MRALGGILLAVALVLSGCSAPQARGYPGCPAGLREALETRSFVAGTQTAFVDIVPVTGIGLPQLAPLRTGCALRIVYRFRPGTGTLYQAIAPGGPGTTTALVAALLRSGWAASGGDGDRLIGPGGRRAQIDWFESHDFLTALPAGYRVPSRSVFRTGRVVLISLVDPRAPATSDAAPALRSP